jgi:hypothetical protein
VSGFEITDIATAHLGDRIIIAVSDPTATQLVVGAYSVDGGQIIAPRLVVDGSDARTNDMKLVVRGSEIHLTYGSDGPEKRIISFNRDLAVVQEAMVVDDPSGGSQLGCGVATDDGFLRVSGNYRNHGLVGVRYDPEWQADDTDTFELAIPAGDDEWLWFSSGCLQDPKTAQWYVAHQHMFDGDNANSESCIQLSRFDADWTYLDTVEVSDRLGYTRPQLALRGDDLYLSFDRGDDDVRVAHTRLDPDR